MPGRLVIVCGLPGSGKTTFARELEQARPAIRLCPDEWMEQLGIDLFDTDARGRVEQLQWQLARRVIELGATAVIEWGTWGRDERDVLRTGARSLGAAVELHLLDPPLDVLWERVRDRDMERRLGRRALTRDDLVAWSATFQRPDADELALYDPAP